MHREGSGLPREHTCRRRVLLERSQLLPGLQCRCADRQRVLRSDRVLPMAERRRTAAVACAVMCASTARNPPAASVSVGCDCKVSHRWLVSGKGVDRARRPCRGMARAGGRNADVVDEGDTSALLRRADMARDLMGLHGSFLAGTPHPRSRRQQSLSNFIRALSHESHSNDDHHAYSYDSHPRDDHIRP